MRGLAGIAYVDPRGVEQLSIPDVAECGTLARAPKQHRGNVSDLVPARLDIVRNRLPFPDHVFLCGDVRDVAGPALGQRASLVQQPIQSQPAALGRKQTRAPDVVALVDDAAQNGLGTDRGWHRALPTELKLLSQQPALRAAAPRNIGAGFVWRHRKELLVTTLE